MKWQTVWLAIFVHTTAMYVAYLLADWLPPQVPIGFVNPALSLSSPIMEKLLKWDAHWYTYVAENGYTVQSIVFFPMLIVVLKYISLLGAGYASSGFILCNIFALLSFGIMYLTFSLDFSKQKTRRALLAYAVMPTSFYLNTIYTESMFITLALACIYFTRTKRWWYAGIFAALATLTRNIGILLSFFMLYELWLAFIKERKLNISVPSLFLPPLALLLFINYNWGLTGDPFAFIHSQQSWGRHLNWPWINIYDNMLLLFSLAPHVEAGMVLDSFLVPLCLTALSVLTFSSSFQIRKSYLLIGWLWFLIPLCSTSPSLPLYSMSRFIVVVFPLYLFMAQIPRAYFYCYLMISTVTLLFCTALFMNWYWIG